MFKVVAITPTTGLCRMGYAQSLARMVMFFSQERIFEDEENQWLAVDSIEGSGIGSNYHEMVKKWLKDDGNWTHILSVEDDMGFEPDVLHIMARRKLPIVGCTYKTNKGWPIRWTAIGLDKQQLVTNENKTGIEEAYVIPQGITLIEREVFENTERPWFMQGYNHETDSYTHVQDYHFCMKASEAGYKCYIDHDASKKCWHIGVKNYRWDVEDTNGYTK